MGEQGNGQDRLLTFDFLLPGHPGLPQFLSLSALSLLRSPQEKTPTNQVAQPSHRFTVD